MKSAPNSVTAALMLILFIAAFWFAFAVITALGLNWSLERTGSYKWIMVVLALGAVLVLAGMAFFLRRRNRIAFYLSVAFLAVLAVLTIADQVGWIDLVTLIITLAALVLLLKDRQWYLQQGSPRNDQP